MANRSFSFHKPNLTNSLPVVRFHNLTVSSAVVPSATRSPFAVKAVARKDVTFSLGRIGSCQDETSQSLRFLSGPPVTKYLLPGASDSKVRAAIDELWPLMIAVLRPVSVDQSLTMRSALPVTRVLPSWEKAIELIQPECPCKLEILRLARTSQICSVPPGIAVNIRLPSGKNATAMSCSSSILNGSISRPLVMSHILTALDSSTIASRRPSGEKVA